jgi:photosystem II stability/assembly factor-like uncharacterized protein
MLWDSLSSMPLSKGASSYNENGVFFLDDKVGYISTRENNKVKLYKTRDGGATNSWEDITPAIQMTGTVNIQFITEKTGYVFADETWSGKLLRTDDSGKTWTQIPLDFELGSGTALFPKMHFIDENSGYLIGGDGTFAYRGIIAHTKDGGDHWDRDTLPMNTTLASIDFPNKDTGYVLTGAWASTIYRTTNGGESWDSLTNLNATNVVKMFFVDGKTGFALSESEIYKTSDAGKTWMAIGPHLTTRLTDIFFTDQKNGYIIGDSGLLLKTTTGGLGIADPKPDTYVLGYPNPSKGIFNFHSDKKLSGTLTIYDSQGRLIVSMAAHDGMSIDLSEQPKGIYYYHIIGGIFASGKLLRN